MYVYTIFHEAAMKLVQYNIFDCVIFVSGAYTASFAQNFSGMRSTGIPTSSPRAQAEIILPQLN